MKHDASANPMLRYFYSDRRVGKGKSIAESSNSMEGGRAAEETVVLEDGEAGEESLDSMAAAALACADAAAKRKRTYELNRHFKDHWAARFPWAEPVQSSEGDITQVRCIVCTKMEGREKLLVPKIDGLWKHAGRRRAARDMVVNRKPVKAGHFYFTSNSHVKNEKLFAAQPHQNIVRQVERQSNEEKRKKIVQLQLLYHLLSLGRPMTDFESTRNLFQHIGVPNLPKKHWSDSAGWELAQSLCHVVKMKTREILCYARFISLSADEVTTIDNQSWLSIHAYVAMNWKRFPILLSLSKIDGAATAENLHNMIVSNTMWHGNVNEFEMARKIICLGADGAGVFQGSRAGVCRLFQDIGSPFLIPMHCCAHRTSLALDKLSPLRIVSKIETLCQVLYTYFNKSPKRVYEFQQLAETLECEGLKILRNVTTRWLSVKEPMERVYEQYQVLIAKMDEDADSVAAARRNLDFLLDLPTLLSFPAMMPLLSTVYTLVQFSQSRDAYICDFIDAVKICQADLHMLYLDRTSAFQEPHFQKWIDCIGEKTHVLTHDWRTDLQTGIQHLCLRIGDHSYQLHFLKDGITRSPVCRADYESCKELVMSECRGAARVLIKELDTRFPNVDVLNALGIVFPQFWADSDCEEVFSTHMEHIREAFCVPKTGRFGEPGEYITKVVDPLLNWKLLSESASMFKLAMASNCPKVLADKTNAVNPLTRLWSILSHSSLLRVRIPEWFKLAEIAIVMVIGSTEDERTFSTLAFMKSKLRNKLTGNLDCTVKLFSQGFFTLETFPFGEAFEHWTTVKERRGVAS